jgi:hypothetical protein
MELNGMSAPALLFLTLFAGLMAGCVVLEVRDVRDLAHGFSVASHVTCAAEDGSAVCRCEQRCVAEPTDCSCGD